MQANLAALEGSLDRIHELAYHFTTKKMVDLILSSGLRASTGGQLGGGVSVCKTPPHEMGWEEWGGGLWRETLGKKLCWGKKWQEVLPGGLHADKLEMVIVVKVVGKVFQDKECVRIIFTRQLARLADHPQPASMHTCTCRVHAHAHAHFQFAPMQ